MEKNKKLGQYYTPVCVSRGIVKLIQNLYKNINSAIDPMCGKGNMIQGLIDQGIKDKSIYGIEIDKGSALEAEKSFANSKIINADAFNPKTYTELMKMEPMGFDLVITNPPYVRYQISTKKNEQDISTLKINLKKIISTFNHLTILEKEEYIELIDSISGLSDLSVPAAILCMALTSKQGSLALIIPETWFSRDYGQDVLKFLKSYFDFHYVVEDVTKAWFIKAQVKTYALIMSKSSSTKNIKSTKFIKLYYDNSKDRNGLNDDLNETSEKDIFLNDYYFGASKAVLSNEKVLLFSSNNVPSKTSCNNNELLFHNYLSDKLGIKTDANLINILELGIKIGQGLRTGANYFFYVDLIKQVDENSIVELSKAYSYRKIEIANNFLYPVVRKQKDYDSTYYMIPKRLSGRLLVIDKLLQRDNNNNDLAEYINLAATTKVRNKNIYDMTAVKPNIKHDLQGNIENDWYQLPKIMPRHVPNIFVPRINNEGVNFFGIGKSNLENIVVDANFSTIWLNNNDNFYWVFAILNSNWTRLMLEDICTKFGGGALKVEATHIKKLFYPKFDKEQLEILNNLGKEMTCSLRNNHLEWKVDKVILTALIGDSYNGVDDIADTLQKKLIEMINERRTLWK